MELEEAIIAEAVQRRRLVALAAVLVAQQQQEDEEEEEEIRKKRRKCTRPGQSMESPSLAELLRLIECPVCTEAMAPPIQQCVNGHSVCGSCRKGVTVCPVCRGPLEGPRNRVAEDLSERLLGQVCENSGRGCTVRLPSGPDLSQHQKSCPKRAHCCIQCRQESLTATDLPAHYSNVHKVPILKISNVKLTLNKQTLAKVPMNTFLIDTMGELFAGWWVARGNLILFGIALCADKAHSFSFKLTIKSSKGAELVFSGPVHTAQDHRLVKLNLQLCEKCVSVTTQFAVSAGSASINIFKK